MSGKGEIGELERRLLAEAAKALKTLMCCGASASVLQS